jgi:hypothetical protein
MATFGLLLACAPACSRPSAAALTRSATPPAVEVTDPPSAQRAEAGTIAHVDAGDVDAGEDADRHRASARDDTFPTLSGVDGWVKALPRAKTYVTLDLAAGVPPSSLLEITWRIHPSPSGLPWTIRIPRRRRTWR